MNTGVARIAALFLTLDFALSVAAMEIQVSPRTLTSRTPVTVRWDGSPLTLSSPHLKIEGNTITVEVENQGCVLAAPCLSGGRFEIPALAGGEYRLQLKDIDGEVFSSKDIQVLDVTTFPILPGGGPLNSSAYQFLSDGQRPELELDFEGAGEGRVRPALVDVPDATQPGVVDVRGQNKARAIDSIARNGFVYTSDPCRDERIWESVLVPIDYDGKGAFGTDWRTDVTISGETGIPMHGLEKPCMFGGGSAGAPGTKPNGYYLRIARAAAHRVNVRVHVRDTVSYASVPMELPVLRENEWLRGVQELRLPIPSAQRRVSLRLYSPRAAFVGITSGSTTQTFALQDMGPDSPFFASVDVSNLGGTFTIRSAAAPFWYLVTVTDNTTQQVFLYDAPKGTSSPQ